MVEKIFQKSSESSLQSQESNKTNGVQFRLRITKNHHKQIKPPKLPFQKTEPNEPIGFVSQPVQMVEKIFEKFSESSLYTQESNKTIGVQFQLRITKNKHKQIKPPKLPFQQTEPNEPAGCVFPTGQDGLKNISKIFKIFLTKSVINKDKRSSIPTPNNQELTQTNQTTQTAIPAN